MSAVVVVILVACLIFASAAFVVWSIGTRIMRVESFLEHLEGRIILLQQAEFSRRIVVEGDRWRKQFGEEPPSSLIDDVRMSFDIFPPFKQCEAKLNAILHKMHR